MKDKELFKQECISLAQTIRNNSINRDLESILRELEIETRLDKDTADNGYDKARLQGREEILDKIRKYLIIE